MRCSIIGSQSDPFINAFVHVHNFIINCTLRVPSLPYQVSLFSGPVRSQRNPDPDAASDDHDHDHYDYDYDYNDYKEANSSGRLYDQEAGRR